MLLLGIFHEFENYLSKITVKNLWQYSKSKCIIIEEKNPGDKTLEKLCASLCKMSKLGKVDSATLQQWLSKVIFGGTSQVSNLPFLNHGLDD